MNLSNLVIVKLLIYYIYTTRAQNATHGNFSYAFDKCRNSGGFAPRDILNLLPFGQNQVENCSVANRLELDDGESLWTHYRTELGAYIAPFGCAKKLPTQFKESVNSTNMLFECRNVCSRKQPWITYIGIQNEECFCLDHDWFIITSCQKGPKMNSASLTYVYELIDISVKSETYACITSVLQNNSRIYDAAKCSGKHQGLCISHKRHGFEAVQQKCLNYKVTLDSIGINICILNKNMLKDDIAQTCSAYNAKMPNLIYNGMERYLTNSKRFFLSSMRTFRLVDNFSFTFDNSTMTCASLYKRGCTIMIEPDRCQNINRFRCQYTNISKEQPELNSQNNTVLIIAILIPSASLLILAIGFVIRYNYLQRTRTSAETCSQNVNPVTPGKEHVGNCTYENLELDKVGQCTYNNLQIEHVGNCTYENRELEHVGNCTYKNLQLEHVGNCTYENREGEHVGNCTYVNLEGERVGNCTYENR